MKTETITQKKTQPSTSTSSSIGTASNILERNLKKIPIEFYISLVSITALFVLLMLDILQKKERIELAKIGYLQNSESKKLDLDSLLNYGPQAVPLLKLFLFNPNREIRRKAVETIKQVNVPEAAAALRQAAEKVNDPVDRAEMLEAARFVELPLHEFDPK